MGKPFGEASRRTFGRIGTLAPFACWNSLGVMSSDTLKFSKQPPSEALKGGLPVPAHRSACLRRSGFAQAGTIRLIDSSTMRLMIPNAELKTFNFTFPFRPYSHITAPLRATNFILEKNANWGRMGLGMNHGERPGPKVCTELRENH